MFWLLTKKLFKKESKKISQSFLQQKELIDKATNSITELTSQSLNNRILIENLEKRLTERIDRIYELREPTPRTSRTTMRKKADKILNKVEIMQEIASLLKQGLSTEEIHQVIVIQKSLIKKTCFYKYLKLVREQTHELREPIRRTRTQ